MNKESDYAVQSRERRGLLLSFHHNPKRKVAVVLFFFSGRGTAIYRTEPETKWAKKENTLWKYQVHSDKADCIKVDWCKDDWLYLVPRVMLFVRGKWHMFGRRKENLAIWNEMRTRMVVISRRHRHPRAYSIAEKFESTLYLVKHLRHHKNILEFTSFALTLKRTPYIKLLKCNQGDTCNFLLYTGASVCTSYEGLAKRPKYETAVPETRIVSDKIYHSCSHYGL